MFEKIKQKSKEAKNWVVAHKSEILVGVVGVAVGALGVASLNAIEQDKAAARRQDYMDNVKPGENLLVDVIRVERESDGYFWGAGNNANPTVENLSEALLKGNEERKDELVIGALVYTKKNNL